MAEQLTIFGLWEQLVAPPVEEPAPSPPLAPPPPIDPRQADLLSGPQTMRGALEAACEALDAPAVLARHRELNERFLGQRWADHAPDWARGIEWLVGAPGAALSLDDQIDRALALRRDEEVARRFPSLPRYLAPELRACASRRAVQRLVAERGAAACLPDGEPAGWLLLATGDAAGARSLLATALATAAVADGREGAATTFPAARAWSWLAEAEWLAGDPDAALPAYCRACLLGGAVTEPALSCEPILDLLDDAADLELPEPLGDWVPVLADLRGHLRLGAEARDPAPDAGPARRLAAELADYRARRATGALDDSGRIAAKRSMARLAPPSLRKLLQAI